MFLSSVDRENLKPIQSDGLFREAGWPRGMEFTAQLWIQKRFGTALSSPWDKCAMCYGFYPNRQKEAAAFDRKLFECMSVAHIGNISECAITLKLIHCSCGSQNIKITLMEHDRIYVQEPAE